MERYFKINDASPNGKILISMIHTMLDFDNGCATDISNSIDEENLIYPGRKLSDAELESLTMVMESDDLLDAEESFKNIREKLSHEKDESSSKKAS